MISVMPVPRNMNFTVLSSGILVPLFSFPLQILIRRMLLDFCKPMCYIECMVATKSAKIFSIFIEYKGVKPNETQKTLRIGTRRSAHALCACRLHLRQNHRRGEHKQHLRRVLLFLRSRLRRQHCVLRTRIFASTGEAMFASLADYLADPDVKASIDAEIENQTDDSMTIKVYADGNALVYEYQFTDEYDLSDEDIKQSVLDALKEGCEENASTFEDIADTLESEVGLSGVHVRLVYLNGDGSEIYTHDFE